MAEAFEITPELAAHLLESSRPSFSLDQEMTKDGESYRDFLVTEWEPEESDRDARLRNRIRHLMQDLDEREKTVLCMRFGLEGNRTATLEEVGERLSLSRERSRQIQQRALAKLLKNAKEKNLEDYL
jgi:RNA polymerase nonessential primary-like sigma factor